MQAAADYIHWFLEASSLPYIVAMYVSILLLELAVGRKERAPWRTVVANCLILLTTLPILVLIRPLIAAVATDSAKIFGGPWLDLTFENGGTIWGQVAAVVITTFVYDFFYYWHHRLQHLSPAAWLTHQMHHADEDMGVTTGYKHHWTDEALRTFTMFIPMGILVKMEPVTMFWLSFLFAFHQLFLHANINLSFGWFNYVLVSPSLHRVHHSKLEEHWDKNFAATWPILDVVFGTFLKPPKEAPPTGIHGQAPITGIVESHVYPFRGWYRMARDRMASAIRSRARHVG